MEELRTQYFEKNKIWICVLNVGPETDCLMRPICCEQSKDGGVIRVQDFCPHPIWLTDELRRRIRLAAEGYFAAARWKLAAKLKPKPQPVRLRLVSTSGRLGGQDRATAVYNRDSE